MPKIVDHVKRREELSDATLRLLARSGLRAITTRSVAEEAGWSTGVVNHYFSSHHDLLIQALRRAVQRQTDYVRTVTRRAGDDPLERLRLMMQASLPLDERSVSLLRIFLIFYAEAGDNTEASEEVREYLSSWRRSVTRLIKAAQSAGQISADLEAVDLASDLIALADGLAIHAILDPDVLTRYEQRGTALLALLEGRWSLRVERTERVNTERRPRRPS
ncbi:TetR family transcriptional regulator C-terminal domain-containing protein [Saccharomonospora sp. NPDC046836]|uniref:TetR/AcrR family transcriptional regulator n=1 Tax=Saccharomonospora sp. NPDC046836 TaxID=3156921 RepID=UPI003411A47A